jgi:MoaA/NifB/PqqE/SkfB family radical SAM enzyme
MEIRKTPFYYYYRLLRWKYFSDRSPVAASLKITGRCNLRCRHCPWDKNSPGDLPVSAWKRIIDGLYAKGVAVAVIEGGEPTLYPGVADVIDYIGSKGMYSILITNATTGLSGLSPDAFWISIDGMREFNDKIRGFGTFDKVVLALTKNCGKKIATLTTLSRDNVSDIEPLCGFLSPLVDTIMFNFAYPYGDSRRECLDEMERRETAEVIMRLKRIYPKIVNSGSYLKSVGRKKAVHPWLLTTVKWDGTAIQGCMVRHIESENCSRCDMGCCTELSNAYMLKRDSVRFWNKSFGFCRII